MARFDSNNFGLKSTIVKAKAESNSGLIESVKMA